MFFIIVFIIIIILSLIIIIVDNSKKEITSPNKNYEYQKKQFMTNTEFYFYKIFEEIAIENNIIIQPQINLASIIDKKNSKYRSELFRNIDFAFFSSNYKDILLLIEINDSTHKQKKRKEKKEIKK